MISEAAWVYINTLYSGYWVSYDCHAKWILSRPHIVLVCCFSAFWIMLLDWNVGAERTGRGKRKRKMGQCVHLIFFSFHRSGGIGRKQVQIHKQMLDLPASSNHCNSLWKTKAFLWYSRVWLEKKIETKKHIVSKKAILFQSALAPQ